MRAIGNYIAREHSIESVNPFANMNYGNAKAPVKRMPMPVEDICKVHKLCLELNDDIGLILCLGGVLFAIPLFFILIDLWDI